MEKQSLHSFDEAQEKRLRKVFTYVKDNPYSSVYRDRLHGVDPGTASTETLDALRPVTIEDLRSHEGTLLHVPEEQARYLVSEFDNDEAESLFLVGERNDERWTSLDASIREHDIKAAVIAVSRNWQLGARFYETCRACEVPCAVFSHRDVPYIARLIEEVGVDLVITTPEVARAVNAILVEKGIERVVKVWILIVELGVRTDIPELPGATIVEHHVFPGISVGTSADGIHLVPSDEYFIQPEPGGLSVTSLEKHAVPFIRLFVAGSVRSSSGSGISFEAHNSE